jgi:hypothetical protein
VAPGCNPHAAALLQQGLTVFRHQTYPPLGSSYAMVRRSAVHIERPPHAASAEASPDRGLTCSTWYMYHLEQCAPKLHHPLGRPSSEVAVRCLRVARRCSTGSWTAC